MFISTEAKHLAIFFFILKNEGGEGRDGGGRGGRRKEERQSGRREERRGPLVCHYREEAAALLNAGSQMHIGPALKACSSEKAEPEELIERLQGAFLKAAMPTDHSTIGTLLGRGSLPCHGRSIKNPTKPKKHLQAEVFMESAAVTYRTK